MKRNLIKLYYFFRSKTFAKYVVTTILLAILFIGFGLLLHFGMGSDVEVTVVGSAFGFAASNIIIYALGIFSRMFEDKIKVNTSTKDIFQVYKNPNYKKIVKLNDSECTICYNDVLINNNCKFEVDDNPNKDFILDGFFEQNFIQLYEAHSSSSKENVKTIRLDDIEKINDKEYILHLSRSNYFNHLVTNRVIDFPLSNGLTVRTFCEYGPNINELKNSKLSNHIGINALVFFDDEKEGKHILFPQRKKDSTISKNGITASIASRLLFPKGKETISKQFLFNDCIYDFLEKRLDLNLSILGKENIIINFLGIGQKIYEGGKPKMYFSVFLKGINLSNYQSVLNDCNHDSSNIDKDKKVHVAKLSKSIFIKNGALMKIDSYNFKKNKYHTYKLVPERSLIANIWHYTQSK